MTVQKRLNQAEDKELERLIDAYDTANNALEDATDNDADWPEMEEAIQDFKEAFERLKAYVHKHYGQSYLERYL